MHDIEPHYGWLARYDSTKDEQSPFYEKEHSLFEFTDAIYGYCIHPQWDFFGSESLYLKVLYADYDHGFAVIEFIGEWNDALHNDIMHLKRNIVDDMATQGINKFILIGENVYNFHGSDDCYYEEWLDDVEEGWICGIGFLDFVKEEWKNFNVDWYINFGGDLEIDYWRTLTPLQLYQKVDQLIAKRLTA